MMNSISEEDILYKTIYETFYDCGLRRGDLCGLTWIDIDFNDKILKVNKNVVAFPTIPFVLYLAQELVSPHLYEIDTPSIQMFFHDHDLMI